MSIVTVPELASFMNMPAPTAPEEVRKFAEHLDAAIENVERLVGPLGTQARDYAVQQSGRYLVLPVTHLTSVESVVDPRGAAVVVSDEMVDRLAGVVDVGVRRTGTWRVTATTGRDAADVRLAVKIIAAHLWETQRGRGDATRNAMLAAGGDQIAPRTPMGFAVPARAADLLAPYVLPGIS